MAGGCLAFLLCYLLVERLLVNRRLASIPVRIAVTGTRGKSSVTRLIAACLREAGMSVVAKTTGSRPVLILPDGSESEIRRRGAASILEAKSLLKAASQQRTRAIVCELMSIHSECLHVESTRILRPGILVITNVRVDHTEQMGITKDSVARCLASAIPQAATVFLPEEESLPPIEEEARRRRARLVRVPNGHPTLARPERQDSLEIEDNIRLCLALTDSLEIPRDVATQAMSRARPDLGALKAWLWEVAAPSRTWTLVSLFAANDPESTRKALDCLSGILHLSTTDVTGLLNLRGDRGDRTFQWLQALKAGGFPEMRRLFVAGEHARIFQSRLRSLDRPEVRSLHATTAPGVMEELGRRIDGHTVLVGLGNMGGIGRALVEHWDALGRPHDL